MIHYHLNFNDTLSFKQYILQYNFNRSMLSYLFVMPLAGVVSILTGVHPFLFFITAVKYLGLDVAKNVEYVLTKLDPAIILISPSLHTDITVCYRNIEG